jgi:hypothetical protein
MTRIVAGNFDHDTNGAGYAVQRPPPTHVSPQ